MGTRREVTNLIKNGRVKVNGIVEFRPFASIGKDDHVALNEKMVKAPIPLVYFLINKPKNISTNPSNEYRCVTSMVSSKTSAQVAPLDEMNPDDLGLLIVTNDMTLIDKNKIKPLLSHYAITAEVPLHSFDSNKLRNTIKVTREDKNINTLYISSTLSTVEIREVFSSILDSNFTIDRTQIGSITKKDLPRGWNRPLTEKEIIFVKYF